MNYRKAWKRLKDELDAVDAALSDGFKNNDRIKGKVSGIRLVQERMRRIEGDSSPYMINRTPIVFTEQEDSNE